MINALIDLAVKISGFFRMQFKLFSVSIYHLKFDLFSLELCNLKY